MVDVTFYLITNRDDLETSLFRQSYFAVTDNQTDNYHEKIRIGKTKKN